MRKGAVYQAYGRKYADQAAISARTLKTFNPWLETAIFADDPDYVEAAHPGAFDMVLPLMGNEETAEFVRILKETGRLFCIKIPAAHQSPFDHTLLIDSDTVILKDLSEEFKTLNEFDILACEEVENIVDTTGGDWNVIGLLNDRRPNYFNSGVMFLNTSSEKVRAFLAEWQRLQLHGGAIIEVNDQETLNHMIYNPLQFMEGIRFSGTALLTRQVNAFCRFWQEIWESGRWNDVSILHTWMSEDIGRRVLDGGIDWYRFFNEETGPEMDYVRRFSIGKGVLLPEAKRAAYAAIGNRNISFAQFMNHRLRCCGDTDPLEAAADLYGMTQASTGYDVLSAVAALKHAAKRPAKTVTVLGVMHQYPNLPVQNRAAYFTIGSDLEFYSEAFGAHVLGYTRMTFLAYRSALCSTAYVEYALPETAWNTPRARTDIVIDADGSQPIETRMANFEKLQGLISGGGQYAFLGISENDMRWVRDHVRESWIGRFKVDLTGASSPRNLILQSLS